MAKRWVVTEKLGPIPDDGFLIDQFGYAWSFFGRERSLKQPLGLSGEQENVDCGKSELTGSFGVPVGDGLVRKNIPVDAENGWHS